MSLIVVEGPDGAGKSTLIAQLREASKRYFWICRASGPPSRKEELGGALYMLGGLARDPDILVVCDRHPLISEPIYGGILRDHNMITAVYEPGAQAASLGYIDRIIYCRPPTRYIQQQISKNKQLKGVMEKLGQIIEAYDDRMLALEEAGLPVLRYDWVNFAYSDANIERLFFGSLA